MSLNASSNQAARTSSVRSNHEPGGAPSPSRASTTKNAPTLSQRASGGNPGSSDADCALTNEQRNLLKVLGEEAQSLRWPVKGGDSAEDSDVLGYFGSLKAHAARLHQIHQAHPEAPQLASCIKALEQALGRIGAALKHGNLEADAFDIDALKTVFGALSALVDPARAPLFNRNQRRALQPLLQDLTSRLLLAHKAGFASAASATDHLPLLNWICRGIKKGLLKQDADIAALFEAALDGLAGWIGAGDQETSSYQIGECAVILNTVIEYDLLLLKANKDRAAELSEKLSRCALQLCCDDTFTLLEKSPVNGVAVVNLCNLVKEMVEAGALSAHHPRLHDQLHRLLTLIAGIPNETMSGGDGRVLSNAGNFLRMLMQHKVADKAEGKALAGMMVTAARRVLAAMNDEGFSKERKNAQSLSNLASFVQDCHLHLLPGLRDESLHKSFSEAPAKLVAKIVASGASAFDDRRAIDGLLVALGYLEAQVLRGQTSGLQALCVALRKKQTGLGRERSAAPVQLNAMDAALPALTTAPKLSGPDKAANAAAQAPRKIIPGDGPIVAPPKLGLAPEIVPGTTHLRTRTDRNDFVEPSGRKQCKAGKVKPDALSLAARTVLRDDSDSEDASNEEAAEPDYAQAGPAAHAEDRLASTKQVRQAGNASASASAEPSAKVEPIDAASLVAALRAGDAAQVERLMRQCKRLPGRQAPPLPEAFLAEVAGADFLAHKPQLKAFNAYLSNFSKADKQLLISHFRKHPPVVEAARELLARHNIVKPFAKAKADPDALFGKAGEPQSKKGLAKDAGVSMRMDSASKGEVATMRTPIQLDAKMEASRNDPIYELAVAALGGDAAKVQKLAKLGVDVKKSSDDGETALMIAAFGGHSSTVQILARYGADVNAVRSDGFTALMLAADKGHTDTVNDLATLGAEVDATRDRGMTALMMAASNGYTSTVQTLLRWGAKVNTCSPHAGTALMQAALNGHTTTLRVLVESQADVNAANDSGETALMVAAFGGHSSTVQILARYGANVHAARRDGVTALMIAAHRGHTATVQALLESGATVNAKSTSGWAALTLAEKSGHIGTAEVLRKAGASV